MKSMLTHWITAICVLAAASAFALGAWAHAPLKVAVLTPGLGLDPVLLGLREGLARLGYEEGKQVVFIVEDTKGEESDLARRARKLLGSKPDVLVTVTAAHTAAAKEATPTVPIVFAAVSDPVGSGLIASYASSKNNLTGVSIDPAPLSGKRLEMLKEVAPGTRRALVLVAVKESVAEAGFRSLTNTAKLLGIRLIRRDVANREEIENALAGTPPGSVDAIYHLPSALVDAHIDLLIGKSKAERMPLIAHDDSLIARGAMATYGTDLRLIGQQAAAIVTKVLRGVKPSEIPIEVPQRLILSIDVTSARAIGLAIPSRVLERADRLR
jgi:putative ABC transport system substrate-binding protein